MREAKKEKTETVIQMRKRLCTDPALCWENASEPFECFEEAQKERGVVEKANPKLYVRTYTYGVGSVWGED
jgi:hypothetical protein